MMWYTCCNVYRRMKWTRWPDFKYWTILFAFRIVLIPLGKVWTLQWAKGQNRLGSLTLVRQPVEEKDSSKFRPIELYLKWPPVVACSCSGGWQIYIYIILFIKKLATIVEGNPKAPFSIATTPMCRGGR